eukprot:TRINITY_DN5042_c0_g1_i1.p2 TRINITY_DN5042_c0_g1~~TRINITY_DN5042_c0_g1_i1.p2  ORF type:complete len:58 (-),score=6.21 TRINITY_DN5042_c0_g1_i1:78-251(-)
MTTSACCVVAVGGAQTSTFEQRPLVAGVIFSGKRVYPIQVASFQHWKSVVSPKFYRT